MEWEESGGCPIHKCAGKHNVQFCGLCKNFPCEWLVQIPVYINTFLEFFEGAETFLQKSFCENI